MNRVITCRRLPVIGVAVVMALGACSSSGDKGPPPTSRPFALWPMMRSGRRRGLRACRSGWVSFTMDTVAGEVDHGLALLRLTDGVTVDDIIHAEE